MSLIQDEQIRAILEKSWEELEALEANDRLYFPFQIKRRKSKGWELVDVTIRVPRENEVRMARIQARKWAEKIELDPSLDPDLFDNMDTLAQLSIAIRNKTAPYEPWEPDPEILEKKYDRTSLDEAWAYVEALRTVINPRVEVLNEDVLLGVIGAIAKRRSIVPLAALDGRAQETLIVTMAERYMSSLGSKS